LAIEKQFNHPMGEQHKRQILIALKKLRVAGVKEIRDCIKASWKAVPSSRTIHTQLNELMENGKVEKNDNRKYKLTNTVTMADIFNLGQVPVVLSLMKMGTMLIRQGLKDAKDNGKKAVEVEESLESLDKITHLISQANNIAKSLDV
jgi:hypothetical protein